MEAGDDQASTCLGRLFQIIGCVIVRSSMYVSVTYGCPQRNQEILDSLSSFSECTSGGWKICTDAVTRYIWSLRARLRYFRAIPQQVAGCPVTNVGVMSETLGSLPASGRRGVD